MKINFIPIDYEAFDYQGKNFIRIIGRDDKNRRICVIDSYEGSFWAILEDDVPEKKIKQITDKIKKIKVKNTQRTTTITKTEIHNKKFLGKDVKAIKIFLTNFKDAHDVADHLTMKEIFKRREYDLPLISKYIMDKKFLPLNWYEIETEKLSHEEFGGLSDVLEVDSCLHLKDFKKIEKEEFTPKILAYDIECDKFELGQGNILMISLYGKNFKKVLTWKKCSSAQDYVECFSSEEQMLKKFVEYVKEQDPDFLVGYFSDGFDLPYLRARAQANKIKLSLGLDGRQPTFSRGRIPTGKTHGIVHIDIFRFIQSVYFQYLKSETLSLNDVASELLKEKKKDFDPTKAIHKSLKHDDWKDFFEYNLQDSVLTYKLAEKIWPDIFQFTKIMQEPVFDVTRSSMSSHVEDHIIHNLERFNEIAQKRPTHDQIRERRAKRKYEGAFVFQPTPGLYKDMAVFDFTSMHASIIVSFNLSSTTLLETKQKDSNQTPDFDLDGRKQKFYFSKQKGFFPSLLEEVVEKRKKYKKEYNKNKNPLTKARSNAYKLLANASYGYLGFFGARYYCREAAASTLALVRQFTNDSIEKIKKKGYKIIFSDTDSIGFQLNKKSKAETKEFLKKLNKELPGIMELDLEGFFKRGLFVSKRTTTKNQESSGAKKKYALIDEKNNLKIRGFETVRRDWCTLSRNLQNQILSLVLKEGNEEKALSLVKKTIQNIKQRKVKKEELIIRTQLKKPIQEYVAQGPHVIAAKKMQAAGLPVSSGDLIEYFIAETSGKTKLVRDKVKLPDEKEDYNIEYYLNNQILPAVENIFEVFNVDVKDIIKGHKQMKLF